jgi:hypothetical protein
LVLLQNKYDADNLFGMNSKIKPTTGNSQPMLTPDPHV